MKPVQTPQDTFTVELTRAEVEMIKGLTQNYRGENPDLESTVEKKVRTNLFVGSMRLLGYNIKDDGTMLRVYS